jgi:hypothetical protein
MIISAAADHAGIVYASTRQGYSLPVIDVSHPAFAIPDDPQALDALRRTFAETERQRKRIPKWLMKGLVWWMARRSRLGRELFASDASYLGGVSTYLMKIGAPNLVPPFDAPLDRRLAAAPAILSMRIRLQQLARLVAEALRPELLARSAAPLHLLDIGGGTAIDSLNTLILLSRSIPAALASRRIVLQVLDSDSEGPEFGRRALDALVQSGPLGGITVEFVHVPYDWTEVSTLAEVARQASHSEAIIAVSTEGGLFEYADDPTVLANLKALHGVPGLTAVAGTVTRADPLTREFLTTSRFKLIPRGAEAFGVLAKQAHFGVSRVESSLLSDQVLLRPDGS